MTFSELLPEIQRLPAFEKLRLIRILAEDLDTAEDFYPLQPARTYHLPTPYESYGAAEVLLGVLEEASDQDI